VAAPTLTLEQAWQLAESANPVLRQALGQRPAAEGELADASALLWNNPALRAERVRRDVPEPAQSIDRRREWSAGIEQTFEIAGQQGYRRRAADLQLEALGASTDNVRCEVRARVERALVQVLALQERIATERLSLRLVEEAARFVRKRVDAGEDSRLDGNLATVEAERARNQIGALEELLLDARADLAAELQLTPQALPVASGNLAGAALTHSLDTLLARAAERPRLRALSLREEAARQRLGLEKAARYPDVTVGLFTGREGSASARERLTTVTLTVPLPLFRRNATGVGRAASELAQARIEHEVEQRNGDAGIRTLWQKQQSLERRVDSLQKAVLPALEENQRLSTKSLQAGEISLAQLMLVNRQVLDGRRDLSDAQLELRLTRVALRLAAGVSDDGSSQW
jgi:cobalt-zinc-cadmium efflux system outer membrane protein